MRGIPCQDDGRATYFGVFWREIGVRGFGFPWNLTNYVDDHDGDGRARVCVEALKQYWIENNSFRK